MKNRYKYSLIFYTGVDTTHACIRIFDRHRLWRGSFSTRAGPGLDPLVTPIIHHFAHVESVSRKTLDDTWRGRPCIRTLGNPSPHHGRAS